MNPNNFFTNSAWISGAQKHLSRTDRLLARIIDQVGSFKPDLLPNTFQALVLSIIHQQLSMKAAATIAGRVRKLCPNGRLSPLALSQVSTARLRKAGMSSQKVSYVHSICDHFLDGKITTAKLKKLSDQQAIELLTDIRGVGVWTAEMILIFSLHRPDVWPVDDLGLRNALKKWYRIPAAAKRDKLVAAGEKFRPYRSVATWYLWKSLSNGITPRLG